jgi:hypothetical protein
MATEPDLVRQPALRREAVFIAADPTAENSLAVPDRVKPARAQILMPGAIERTLPAYSVSVLRPAR